MIRVIIREREPINAGARALFLSNAAEERIESLTARFHRIVPESFLIAEWRDDPATINKQSTNENNTDVDRWVDARRLRINGKPCS